MSEVKRKTAQEVVLPGGEDTEENLPLFPTPPAEPAQDFTSKRRNGSLIGSTIHL